MKGARGPATLCELLRRFWSECIVSMCRRQWWWTTDFFEVLWSFSTLFLLQYTVTNGTRSDIGE